MTSDPSSIALIFVFGMFTGVLFFAVGVQVGRWLKEQEYED